MNQQRKFKLGLMSAAGLALVSPAALILACAPSGAAAALSAAPRPLFVDAAVQESATRKQLQVDNIKRADLTAIASRGLGFFQAAMLAGGFGESRLFYSDSAVPVMHTGTDVLLPTNTPILAPTDGEVLASFWYQNTAAGADFANGVGGIILMRAKLADLPIAESDKELVYIEHGVTNAVSAVPRFVFRNLDGTYTYPQARNLVAKTANDNLTLGAVTPEGQTVVNSYELTFYNTAFHQVVTEQAYQEYLTRYYAGLTSDEARAEARARLAARANTVLLQFMHASNNSPEALITTGDAAYRFSQTVGEGNKQTTWDFIVNRDIDTSSPRSVKRCAVIGYVGSTNDNGGWVPHLHLSVRVPLNGNVAGDIYNRFDTYAQLGEKTDAQLRTAIQAIHERGIFFATNTSGTVSASYLYQLANAKAFLNGRGQVDPNALYQLYDASTPVVRYDQAA